MKFKIKKLKKGSPHSYKCKWRLRYNSNGEKIEKFFDHSEDMFFYLRMLIRK